MPEAEARMVEAMYDSTKGRVVDGSGLSEEFPVNMGLRQGNILSPLLLIMVMELISTELQQVLEEWKGVFEKHGLRMSLEKTDVM